MSPEVAEVERMPLTEADGVDGVDGGNEKVEKVLEAKVVLDGKEFTLCYDWDAQIRAEEMTGMNILVPQGSPSAVTRAVLLARMLKHHPEMTLDKLGTLMPTNMKILADALNRIGEYQRD